MEKAGAVAHKWAAGDYATVGDKFANVGQGLVDEVGVAGLDVLDVAAGTGNTAIPAAKAGGRVTAVDITPELLAIARARADVAGVTVRWTEGDMTALPYPDRSFDRVLSTFGVFLATDRPAMAAELVRVCRPGGLVAVTAWRPSSAFSKLEGVIESFLPNTDTAAPKPTDWGRPQLVTTFFAGQPVTVITSKRFVTMHWSSVGDAITMESTQFGPLLGPVAEVKRLGKWPAARVALEEMLASENIGSGGTLVIDMPYLLTIARRH
ncbi:MAG: class I SAM-dependent methyltransferase [Mycobacteriales bacterium]